MLQETTLPDLVRGLAALRSQLSEHTGQLKALVKENFDRFISRCAAGLMVGCIWLPALRQSPGSDATL